MNFARAKTILIVIFIFVNIFLLTVYNLFYESSNAVDTQTALNILKNNSITVDENIIKNYGSSLPGVEIENLATDESKLASILLGNTFNTPRNHYYTANGQTLTITDLAIDYKIIEPDDKSFKNVTSLSAGNKTLKALLKKGIGKSVLEVSNVSESSGNHFFVTFSYKYEDYPVFNNNLYATVTDKGISTVKGTIISFKNLDDTEYDITPTANILLELPSNSDLKAEFKNPKVTDIRLGYYLPLGKTEASIYAIPAYEIEIDDKKIYYYDARENINSDVVLLGSRNIIK